MVTISRELESILWGDDAILKYLDMCRDAFVSGDGQGLLYAVFLCARFQAVIPEWAADGLLAAENDLEAGAVQDVNAVFGWPEKKLKADQNKRAKAHRQRQLTPKVMSLLHEHRLAGGALNTELDMQEIADRLGISRKDVEDIYKASGASIKKLPRGNPKNIVFARMHGVISRPRRYGRPILSDSAANPDTEK